LHRLFLFFLFTTPHTLCPPLLPYTTLFRSEFSRERLVHYQYRRSRRNIVLRKIASLADWNAHCREVTRRHNDDIGVRPVGRRRSDRKSTRLNSSLEWISYAVFCLKKTKNIL